LEASAEMTSPAAPADGNPGRAAEQPAADQPGEIVLARAVSAYRAALDQRLSVFWGTPMTLRGQVA
jgi:hypothetical protein